MVNTKENSRYYELDKNCYSPTKRLGIVKDKATIERKSVKVRNRAISPRRFSTTTSRFVWIQQ